MPDERDSEAIRLIPREGAEGTRTSDDISFLDGFLRRWWTECGTKGPLRECSANWLPHPYVLGDGVDLESNDVSVSIYYWAPCHFEVSAFNYMNAEDGDVVIEAFMAHSVDELKERVSRVLQKAEIKR